MARLLQEKITEVGTDFLRSFHESSNSTIRFKIVIRRISLGRNPIDPAKVHRRFFNGHSKVARFHSRSRSPWKLGEKEVARTRAEFTLDRIGSNRERQRSQTALTVYLIGIDIVI